MFKVANNRETNTHGFYTLKMSTNSIKLIDVLIRFYDISITTRLDGEYK
jgi:hypothetical protein